MVDVQAAVVQVEHACMKATQRQSRLGTEIRSSSRRLCRCQMRISASPHAANTSLYWKGKAISCTLLGGAVCSISACSFLPCIFTNLLMYADYRRRCVKGDAADSLSVASMSADFPCAYFLSAAALTADLCPAMCDAGAIAGCRRKETNRGKAGSDQKN